MTKRKIHIEENDATSSGGNGTPPQDDEVIEVITPEAQEEPSDQAIEAATEPVEVPAELEPDLTDQLQRLAAEFENYKKKNAREFERGHQAGAAYIIERLVPVLDSFDSALQTDVTGAESGVLEGLKKIRGQMIELLIGSGLEVIEPDPGDTFDPNIHEVLLCQETEEFQDNTVFATLQRGYSYKNRLIRAAKVQLAVAPNATCTEQD